MRQQHQRFPEFLSQPHAHTVSRRFIVVLLGRHFANLRDWIQLLQKFRKWQNRYLLFWPIAYCRGAIVGRAHIGKRCRNSPYSPCASSSRPGWNVFSKAMSARPKSFSRLFVIGSEFFIFASLPKRFICGAGGRTARDFHRDSSYFIASKIVRLFRIGCRDAIGLR
jgi:hypothetical protein